MHSCSHFTSAFEFYFDLCRHYGAFTLPDSNTDKDTETDELQQYSMAFLSQCSVNTSTQFHTTHFLSVSVSVSVSGSVNTPLVATEPILERRWKSGRYVRTRLNPKHNMNTTAKQTNSVHFSLRFDLAFGVVGIKCNNIEWYKKLAAPMKDGL